MGVWAGEEVTPLFPPQVRQRVGLGRGREEPGLGLSHQGLSAREAKSHQSGKQQ